MSGAATLSVSVKTSLSAETGMKLANISSAVILDLNIIC